jgi:hypothetical protein
VGRFRTRFLVYVLEGLVRGKILEMDTLPDVVVEGNEEKEEEREEDFVE